MVHKRQSRSEIKAHRKGKMMKNKSFHSGNLMNVTKNRAGMKLPHKNMHNMSYNEAYGMFDDDPHANYSSIM